MATIKEICDKADDLAESLIDESTQENCIAHHEYDSELEDALLELSDNAKKCIYIDETVYEFWTDDWRVHLTDYEEQDDDL